MLTLTAASSGGLTRVEALLPRVQSILAIVSVAFPPVNRLVGGGNGAPRF